MPRLLALLLAGLAAVPGAAQAQDRFLRDADYLRGRPVLLVAGAAVGQLPVRLALAFGCPGDEVWTLDLTGAEFQAGAPITLDLGGEGSGWHEVRLLTVRRPAADWLRLTIDETSFRMALARARAVDAAPGDPAAVLQIGRALGLAIGLDGLALALGDLARDCAALSTAQGRVSGGSFARYAR